MSCLGGEDGRSPRLGGRGRGGEGYSARSIGFFLLATFVVGLYLLRDQPTQRPPQAQQEQNPPRQEAKKNTNLPAPPQQQQKQAPVPQVQKGTFGAPPQRPDRKPGPPQRIGFVPAEGDPLLPPLSRLDANTFDRGLVVTETTDDLYPEDSGFTSSIRPRRYLLHVPEAVQRMLEDPNNKEKVPLVLVFHGMSRTSWYTALNETKWLERADRERFVVVFPQSLGSHDMWGGRTGWVVRGVGDIIYAREVISDILYEAGHAIDPNRIYAIGLSNGGMFLTTLLLDPRFQFAAGCIYMGGYVQRHNPPAHVDHTQTPVLLITGSEDKMLPYSRDAELVFRVAGHHVEFDEVAGMGHEYRTDHEDRIWDFFSKHSLEQ